MNGDGVVSCVHCGSTVVPTRSGTWREVIGWVEQRSGGGVHGVHGQEATGRYACASCMALLRRGIAVEQGKLL